MAMMKNKVIDVVEWYERGMTPDQIAKVTGLDVEMVTYWINLSGEYPDTVECEDVPF
jgi:hypothetical protein